MQAPVLLHQIDPLVIEVMKEKGIDLSAKRPKSLNDLPPIEMDYLVTMGCEETCPAVPAKKIIEWEIPDPKGKSIDVFREVRDLIEEKVRSLLKEMEELKMMNIRKENYHWVLYLFSSILFFLLPPPLSLNRSSLLASVRNIIPASCISSISPS